MQSHEWAKYLAKIVEAEPSEIAAILEDLAEEEQDVDVADLIRTAKEQRRLSRFVWGPGEVEIIKGRPD